MRRAVRNGSKPLAVRCHHTVEWSGTKKKMFGDHASDKR
jgi:hypothetical protein